MAAAAEYELQSGHNFSVSLLNVLFRGKAREDPAWRLSTTQQ